MQLNECQRQAICDRAKATGGRVLFATACGPRLYGFPHQERYVEVRGVHLDAHPVTEARSCLAETREWRDVGDTCQVEWVSHELGKFVRLLEISNGGAYEQLFSPHVVTGGPELEELRDIASTMLSQQLFVHYRSFFHGQLKFFLAQRDRHGRHLLYLYRVALTGIHLMEHGALVADLPQLARYHERAGVSRLLRELEGRKDVAVGKEHLQELAWLDGRLATVPNVANLPDRVAGREAEAWLASVRAREAAVLS
jgi:predicted nucleotidyltransferase